MNRRLTALTVATIGVCSIAAMPEADAAPTTTAPRTATVVVPSAAPTTTPMLRVGSRGDQVTELQQRFARWGYTITVDGWFGPQTEQVVRRWQTSNGITSDGIVGPQTRGTFNVADALAGTAGATAGAGADRQPPVTDPPQQWTPERVQQLIRDVWPDNLEAKALLIAHRESRYVPTARNSCCHGIFQINWGAHHSWLAGYGVTSVEQLYDPEVNVRMAFVLYQRAGGWGPWAQTAY